MSEILQMLPHPSRRGAERARDELLDKYMEEINRIGRGSSHDPKGDRVDRLVPQVFIARVDAVGLGSAPGDLRTWWTYSWEEYERTSVVGAFVLVPHGRTSVRSGNAINLYELSVDDDGGNVGPATQIRLAIPGRSYVEMHLDPSGRAWFDRMNPVEIVCP